MPNAAHIFIHYLKEILPALAVGFFISGIVHELIPENMIDRYLGRKGMMPIIWATLIGAVLPVCCWGSLPIAVSFHKKGAKLGPILAFLVATPATSISAILVVYSVLGAGFAVYSFFSVIIMGLVMGVIGNLIARQDRPASIAKENRDRVRVQDAGHECAHCKRDILAQNDSAAKRHGKDFRKRVLSILSYAFMTLPKEIGLELAAGIFIASIVAAFVPIGNFIHAYLFGWAGYFFSVVFGIITYLCATASVPLVDSLIRQGLSAGAGMTLLLIGPITSYGTMLVLRKEFGMKTLAVFLAGLVALTIMLGVGFRLIAGS